MTKMVEWQNFNDRKKYQVREEGYGPFPHSITDVDRQNSYWSGDPKSMPSYIIDELCRYIVELSLADDKFPTYKDKEREAYQKYKDRMMSIKTAHYNPLVLHDPADGCLLCNERSDLQDLRKKLRINFTGKYWNWYPCPAERKLTLAEIEEWNGNRVYTGKDREVFDARVRDIISPGMSAEHRCPLPELLPLDRDMRRPDWECRICGRTYHHQIENERWIQVRGPVVE